MTTFPEIVRPPKNRRRLADPELDAWDADLEEALLGTLYSTRAIQVPLAMFHSSPAKGRLWKRGYRVLHRVTPDRQYAAAWVVNPEATL